MLTSVGSSTSSMPVIELTVVPPSLIASLAMCECASMMPGDTNWPVVSMISAPAGHRDVRADGGDLAVPQQHRAVWNRAVGDGQDRAASERDEPPGCGGLAGLTLNADGGDRNQDQERTQSQKPDRRVSAGHANLLVSRRKE